MRMVFFEIKKKIWVRFSPTGFFEGWTEGSSKKRLYGNIRHAGDCTAFQLIPFFGKTVEDFEKNK